VDWWSEVLKPLGYAFLLLAGLMTLWSMVNYLRLAWPILMETE